jgi:hypothetical protein
MAIVHTVNILCMLTSYSIRGDVNRRKPLGQDNKPVAICVESHLSPLELFDQYRDS